MDADAQSTRRSVCACCEVSKATQAFEGIQVKPQHDCKSVWQSVLQSNAPQSRAFQRAEPCVSVMSLEGAKLPCCPLNSFAPAMQIHFDSCK